jgi:RNA polymerase sigma-70 factor (ECF subfamily)
VLVARVWGQLSLEEVARLCGVSTATAFRRYEAALKTLRAKLETKCENRK